MMREIVLTVELPAEVLLTLPLEAGKRLEAALRKQRLSAQKERDHGAEIEQFLLENGPATLPEIARGITARDADVRDVLDNDKRFIRVPPTSDRSRRAKPWTLASSAPGLSPSTRTSPR
jgi:hypothetical protein